MRKAIWIVLLGLAACGGPDPAGEVLGHWKSDARELYVEDGALHWILGGRTTRFEYDVTAADPATRTLDLKVRGPGGVTYRFEFAEGYGSATMTEQNERRAVHRFTRVDDKTRPG